MAHTTTGVAVLSAAAIATAIAATRSAVATAAAISAGLGAVTSDMADLATLVAFLRTAIATAGIVASRSGRAITRDMAGLVAVVACFLFRGSRAFTACKGGKIKWLA